MGARGAAIAAGLLCAAFAQYLAYHEYLAFHQMGSGDGWITPVRYSPILFVAYPLAFARLFERERRSVTPEILLLAGAAVVDFLFIRACLGDSQDDQRMPAVIWPMLWLVLWLFWQALPIIAIATRGEAARRSPASLALKAAAAFAGLLVAACAQLIAFILNAMGEGWGSPTLASLFLFLAYPAALVRLADRQNASIKGDLLLLAGALLADAYLLVDSLYMEYHYFRRGLASHPIVDIWLGLWLLSHALPIAAIALKVRRGDAPQPTP